MLTPDMLQHAQQLAAHAERHMDALLPTHTQQVCCCPRQPAARTRTHVLLAAAPRTLRCVAGGLLGWSSLLPLPPCLC